MSIPTTRRGIMTALTATLLLPGVAASQLSDPLLDRMHDEAVAVAYSGAPDGIERAVLLHGQVVHQRMPHDGRRFECLKSHANLLYYYGHLEGARLYMEAAAEQAANRGLDYEAAMTFVEAAILAREAGDVKAVRTLADRAMNLSTSPRLDTRQRAEIRARIGQ